MKKSLLATVAAVALIAGTGLASAEGAAKDQPGMKAGAEVQGQSQGQGHGDKNGDMKKSGGAKAGAEIKGKAQTTGAGGADAKAAAEGKADMKAGADSKADTKAKADTRANDSKSRSTTGQGGQGGQERPGQMERSSPQQGTQERSQQRNQDAQAPANQRSPGAAQGQTSTTNNNVSVNLTSEQKTKIRTTVLRSSGAPKVSKSNINFSINVGTVVPRTVKVVAVPTTLVEIHPAWRGYMYFIVDDEIIIVEPRTLRIVAVLDV